MKNSPHQNKAPINRPGGPFHIGEIMGSVLEEIDGRRHSRYQGEKSQHQRAREEGESQ